MKLNVQGVYQMARRKCKSLEERFWEKVQKAGHDECWLWTAATDTHGYGRIFNALGVTPRVTSAHRVSWELINGPVPDGLHVCHDCPDGDNPSCVNPAHLFLGTQLENMRDMDRKGRRGFTGVLGAANGKTKLTEANVRSIRQRYASGGIGMRPLAREYGVTRQSIQAIIRGENWAWIA